GGSRGAPRQRGGGGGGGVWGKTCSPPTGASRRRATSPPLQRAADDAVRLVEPGPRGYGIEPGEQRDDRDLGAAPRGRQGGLDPFGGLAGGVGDDAADAG